MNLAADRSRKRPPRHGVAGCPSRRRLARRNGASRVAWKGSSEPCSSHSLQGTRDVPARVRSPTTTSAPIARAHRHVHLRDGRARNREVAPAEPLHNGATAPPTRPAAPVTRIGPSTGMDDVPEGVHWFFLFPQVMSSGKGRSPIPLYYAMVKKGCGAASPPGRQVPRRTGRGTRADRPPTPEPSGLDPLDDHAAILGASEAMGADLAVGWAVVPRLRRLEGGKLQDDDALNLRAFDHLVTTVGGEHRDGRRPRSREPSS